MFIAAWYPLARIVLFGMTGRLGANPIEFITRSTGLWTLVFLCITLAVTPLRRLTGVAALRALSPHARAVSRSSTPRCISRRTSGSTSGSTSPEILKDIGKRPFITVGFAAFVLLIPLAVTSPHAMVRKLGRRWQTLHRRSMRSARWRSCISGG